MYPPVLKNKLDDKFMYSRILLHFAYKFQESNKCACTSKVAHFKFDKLNTMPDESNQHVTKVAHFFLVIKSQKVSYIKMKNEIKMK